MDTITTTLRRKPFTEIVNGEKHIEYRLIKPYWTSRLKKVRTPFILVLRNGMNRPVPVLTVRIDRIEQNPEDLAGHYGLHIGKILKVEHWDRKTGKPR